MYNKVHISSVNTTSMAPVRLFLTSSLRPWRAASTIDIRQSTYYLVLTTSQSYTYLQDAIQLGHKHNVSPRVQLARLKRLQRTDAAVRNVHERLVRRGDHDVRGTETALQDGACGLEIDRPDGCLPPRVRQVDLVDAADLQRGRWRVRP